MRICGRTWIVGLSALVYVGCETATQPEESSLPNFKDNIASYKLVIGIGVGTLFGVLSANVSPFTIGVLISGLGFTPEGSGLLVTAELMTLSLAAILVAPFLSRAGIGRVALVGILLILTGQTATLFIDQFHNLLAIRIYTAIGFGLVYAAANAAGATAENPDRVFSLSITFSLVVLALLLPAVGKIVASFGFRGFVLSVLFTILIFAPALLWLQSATESNVVSLKKGSVPRKPELATLFLIIALFSIGTGAAWTFMERVGVDKLALNGEQIGVIIGLSTVAGIVGAFSVSWLSKRFSRRYPLLVGLISAGFSSFLLTSGLSVPLFVVGGILYWGSYMLVYPYLIGIACDLDSTGRGAAAAAGTLMLSFALGPLAAGSILAVSNYETLGVLCLSSCLLAAALAFPLLRSLAFPKS